MRILLVPLFITTLSITLFSNNGFASSGEQFEHPEDYSDPSSSISVASTVMSDAHDAEQEQMKILGFVHLCHMNLTGGLSLPRQKKLYYDAARYALNFEMFLRTSTLAQDPQNIWDGKVRDALEVMGSVRQDFSEYFKAFFGANNSSAHSSMAEAAGIRVIQEQPTHDFGEKKIYQSIAIIRLDQEMSVYYRESTGEEFERPNFFNHPLIVGQSNFDMLMSANSVNFEQIFISQDGVLWNPESYLTDAFNESSLSRGIADEAPSSMPTIRPEIRPETPPLDLSHSGDFSDQEGATEESEDIEDFRPPTPSMRDVGEHVRGRAYYPNKPPRHPGMPTASGSRR